MHIHAAISKKVGYAQLILGAKASTEHVGLHRRVDESTRDYKRRLKFEFANRRNPK